MKLTKKEKEFLENFLNETGFEIWNAGCTHRMSASHGDAAVKVGEYHNPLHGKEYKDINSAIKYMQKQDE